MFFVWNITFETEWWRRSNSSLGSTEDSEPCCCWTVTPVSYFNGSHVEGDEILLFQGWSNSWELGNKECSGALEGLLIEWIEDSFDDNFWLGGRGIEMGRCGWVFVVGEIGHGCFGSAMVVGGSNFLDFKFMM